MKKSSILIVVAIVLLGSCGQKSAYDGLTFSREEANREIPYELLKAKKESHKLVVILKDNIDSTQLKGTDFQEYFTDRKYNIVFPGKPGENENQIRIMDQKKQRLDDLTALIERLDTLRKSDLIIIGFGEGGYLAPQLGQRTQANASLSINAGPFSPLQELETWTKSDTIILEAVEVMKEMDIDSKEDLREKVQQIKKEPYGSQVFPDQTNAYHLSYYKNPLADQVQYIEVPVYFIISKDAGMVTVESQNVLAALSTAFSNIHYAIIPGRGAFTVEKEMELLIDQMNNFLLKRESY